MDTIDYYNKYAATIFEDTVDRDLEEVRQEFLKYLEEGDTILDLGCGSGRDSLAFYDLGYDVTPMDASEEMCQLAEIHTDLEVLQLAYEEMEFDEVFDGIWGCGALVHVPPTEMDEILERIINALEHGGILYLSFREGDFQGFRGGRYYCDYSEQEIERLLKKTGRLKVKRVWVSEDDRGDGDWSWVNVLAKKIG